MKFHCKARQLVLPIPSAVTATQCTVDDGIIISGTSGANTTTGIRLLRFLIANIKGRSTLRFKCRHGKQACKSEQESISTIS
ncbi:hypothetical protein PILCRDRAFT_824812 [Piloderma croceum F 1598]|uniref:Uncharacterized protein n=1 Tax=Piloderma croceum (strain F 1598) TaxID=765440 RepID=A0A0C3FDX3_PILCF|nr:hypothetical protein PILCRDRAFT_824812 [Piloderma croceum F 1598]